jgi:hypothetical protein
MKKKLAVAVSLGVALTGISGLAGMLCAYMLSIQFAASAGTIRNLTLMSATMAVGGALALVVMLSNNSIRR